MMKFYNGKGTVPCHEDIWGNGSTVPPFLAMTLDRVER
jgi:hypothetical protein